MKSLEMLKFLLFSHVSCAFHCKHQHSWMLLLYICYKGVASEIGGELLLALMDGLTDEFWQDPLWTVMFIDDIVICGESNEQVEDNLEEGGGGIHVCE